MGRRCLRNNDLVRGQGVCLESSAEQPCPSRSATYMCPSVPRCGRELEQIQFLLGHVSVQTTEKYLGCKQRLRVAVNDHIGIEPED